MKENELRELLQGAQISYCKRSCNLIMFNVKCCNGESLNFHVECFLKVIKDNITLISSNDMFVPCHSINPRKFRWDKPNMSLFDESVNVNREMLNAIIEQVHLEYNEIRLELSSNVTMKIVPDTVQNSEAFIFFTKDKTYLSYINP